MHQRDSRAGYCPVQALEARNEACFESSVDTKSGCLEVQTKAYETGGREAQRQVHSRIDKEEGSQNPMSMHADTFRQRPSWVGTAAAQVAQATARFRT